MTTTGKKSYWKTPEGRARYLAAYETTLDLWPVVLATCHIPSQKRQCSPLHVAGAIRLFPPSSQGPAACRKVKVAQHTMAFPFVPQVPSAF
jgi:hypothetical protein